MDIEKPQLPHVAGYTTEAILGKGGMSTVYLAVQESLSRHVALKVMNQLLTINQEFCRRFLNEGRLIAKLSHPNIVTVYDIGASDSIHYLSMTYLPGGTLKDIIRDGLPPDRAIYILKCLADALGYAHARGIVHRDIKPGNVLFTDSDTPVLTDFGIAKTVGDETKLTSTGMTVGSSGYMSPEQTLGHEVDHRSDLYSLGVLFWQMLTGALPYSAPDPFSLAFKHAHDPVPQLPDHLHRFQPVIEGLLAKKPEDRPASAEALVQLVDGIQLGDVGDVGDIGADAPSDPAETMISPPVQGQTPSPPNLAAGIAVQPTPKRRIGPAAALTAIAGLAGIAGYVGYTGLLSPTPEAPPASPSGLKNPAGPTESASLPPAATVSPDNLIRKASLPTAVPDSQDERSDDPRLLTDTQQQRAVSQAAGQGAGQQSIEELLRQAEEHRNAGRLIEPRGENAFESYSRVLDLDPEHIEAKQRLVQIGRINAAHRMFLSAENLLQQGKIEDARLMIETGLKLNPQDKRLLGLQRALDY